ncbi:MAG: hypothetical protein IKC75_07355 [Clostridia bacterium]|nr:hypothetical protein [Clostridia bacterium]
MEKTALIQKLKKIKDLFSEVKRIQSKISNATAKDAREKVEAIQEPVPPKAISKPVKNSLSLEDYISKNAYFFLPLRFIIASVVQFFLFLCLRGGVRHNGSEADKIQLVLSNIALVILIVLVGIVASYFVIHWFKKIK